MRYVSTRGGVPAASFEQVLFAGLAADGGLYVPESWPKLDRDALEALHGAAYQDVALRVLAPFVEDDLGVKELRDLIARAYAAFDHVAVAPLRQIGSNEWLLELFHGPTLAFKDMALQLLGLLFEHFLARRRQSITIVGATSGDTGSAAICACAGRARMRVVILHPFGRVSEVQRRQMTTVAADNVHNVAIEGSFDDCQALIKAMFNDAAFRDELRLSAVNSINWARIMAQIVYYVSAALSLGAPDRRV
ncbi:MAG: pyridoxal-phosphate dependent enzyme, partial [Geminicoccaceae bacterium]